MAWTQIAELLPGEVVALTCPTTGRGASGPCIWSAPRNGAGQDGGEVQWITAIPQLLNLLSARLHRDLDAMGCQREIAQQIVDGGTD